MKRSRWTAALLAAALSFSAALQAQQRGPNIGYIYPAGGKQGATFEAAIRGQSLDRATNVIVTGEGVRVTILDFCKPIDGRTRNLMRDRMDNLQAGLRTAKKGEQMIMVRSELNTNEIQRLYRTAVSNEINEIRAKFANPKTQQRAPNPQLSQDLSLRIAIAPGAAPGERELRVLTGAGLSNPVKFWVGQLPEFSRKPVFALTGPNNPNADLARIARLFAGGPGGVSERDMRVTIPCVINGQAMPGNEDRFRFSARAGQRLVISVQARELIPYIADAVPGWFQATLGLYDANGKEVAYDDDFRFHPDPVLYYVIPKDGDYSIGIKDSIYRGREDFVYRITVGEVPFVTGIFPLGGRVGEPKSLALTGWNLGATNLDVTFNEPGVRWIATAKGDMPANRVPFAVDTLPECLEREPNDLIGSAQQVKFPVIINGRVDLPGDIDVYRFEGRAGQKIVAEVMARRLDSPLDSVLKLTDANGKQLAFNDDYEDRGTGLNTHHADSYIAFKLPADGAYYLQLTDPQRKGGPEYAYRLRISAPQPDFALRVVPASLTMRPGSSAQVIVYAVRHDGFAEDITVALRDMPDGFKLSGRIPGNTNEAKLTLTAPGNARSDLVKISVEGRAQIGGKQVAHLAMPATDMMQAFAYRHLVPVQDLEIAMVGRGSGNYASNKGGGKGKTTAPPSKTPSKTTSPKKSK